MKLDRLSAVQSVVKNDRHLPVQEGDLAQTGGDSLRGGNRDRPIPVSAAANIVRFGEPLLLRAGFRFGRKLPIARSGTTTAPRSKRQLWTTPPRLTVVSSQSESALTQEAPTSTRIFL